MKDKLYNRILMAIVIMGVLITLAHVGYMIYAYPNSSIIYFVSKELW